MSVSAAVAKLLADQGFGVLRESAWVGGLRDGNGEPDKQFSVGMYDGVAIETFASADPQHSIQVMVRGDKQDYLVTETWAMDMWRYLVTVRNVTVAVPVDGDPAPDPISVPIQVIRPRGTIAPLGADNDQRPLFSINLEVTQ